MSTPKYLSAIADALEVEAGASTTANKSSAGYWKRIALAAETLAGASSNAANFLTGWMKRAAVAFGAYTGISGSGYNSDEPGYLAWMVAGMEDFLGLTTSGSLEARALELINDAVNVLQLEDNNYLWLENGRRIQLG